MHASRRIAIWVVLGLMLLAIGGYVAWSIQHEQHLAEQRGACEHYSSLRNIGVAHLEDGNIVGAEEPLTELNKLLPNDPVGVRKCGGCGPGLVTRIVVKRQERGVMSANT